MVNTTFGYTSDSYNVLSAENTVLFGYFKMGTTHGIGRSISCRVYSVTSARTYKMGLYDDSLNFIIDTAQVNVAANYQDWITANFTYTPFLTKNAWYYLGVYCNDASGFGYGFYLSSAGTGNGVWQDTGLTYPTWPSTLSKDSTPGTTMVQSIYCTYTIATEQNLSLFMGMGTGTQIGARGSRIPHVTPNKHHGKVGIL